MVINKMTLMNLYYTEVIMENGGNVKKNVQANSKEEAIIKVLDSLDNRRFDDAIRVDVVEDKNNK